MTGIHTDIFAVSDVATTIMESNDTTGNGIEMPKACLRHTTAESMTHRAKLGSSRNYGAYVKLGRTEC